MKKRKTFLRINSLTKVALILLLMVSSTIFANSSVVSSKMSLKNTATSMLALTTHQTLAITADKAKEQHEAPAKAKHTTTKGDYDKIDAPFKGIGPGNNTLPFIIAFVVFLVAVYFGKKFKGTKKIIFTVLSLLALAYLVKITYVEARALGRQQGYAPVQPIWFSHKIHATQNGIDCEYCHVDARTSRHAGVPSLNVCMNCHTQVKEGTVSGTKEIAKIYEHVGFNPKTSQYDKPGKPIEWVKVHNLPDHVYFNHAQHVQVGKVACQECHGPVEEMNRVVEYKEFAMGDFCLDCHRKRNVDTSNPYYKHYKFKELKEKQGIDKITVDKIGGADCSSCHY